MINRTANFRTRLPGLIETQASTLKSQTKPLVRIFLNRDRGLQITDRRSSPIPNLRSSHDLRSRRIIALIHCIYPCLYGSVHFPSDLGNRLSRVPTSSGNKI